MKRVKFIRNGDQIVFIPTVLVDRFAHSEHHGYIGFFWLSWSIVILLGRGYKGGQKK